MQFQKYEMPETIGHKLIKNPAVKLGLFTVGSLFIFALGFFGQALSDQIKAHRQAEIDAEIVKTLCTHFEQSETPCR